MGLFHSPDLMFKDFGFVSLGDLVQDFCGSAKYAGVKVKRVIIGLPLEPPPKFDVYPLLQWQVGAFSAASSGSLDLTNAGVLSGS